MSVEIRIGSIREYRAELQPLLEAHVAELTTDPEIMVLEPRWEVYEVAEDQHALLTLYAVDDELGLVGYSCTILGDHLHYGGMRYAHNDVLYVLPEVRNSRTGLRLIRETERLAEQAGAKLILWHAKPGTPLDVLLTRWGYRTQDIIHSRRLGQWE